MKKPPVSGVFNTAGIPAYFSRMAPFFLKNLLADRVFLSAASLAFQTLLSMVPFLAVTLSVLRVFPFFAELKRYIEEFILQNFVPSSGELFQRYFEEFIAKTSSVTLVGGVLLFIIALSLISTIDSIFNDIWRVRSSRKPMQAFTLYWTVLTLGPVLIGGSLAASSYVWFTVFTEGPLLEMKTRLISFLPFMNSLAAFFLLYVLVPNCRVKFLHAFSGAALAALLFELSKKWFVFYVSRFATFEHIYGALSAVPMLFFWIYLGWLVVLTGAELVFTLGAMRHDPPAEALKKTLQGLAPVLSVLGSLLQDQQGGWPLRAGKRKEPGRERIIDLLLEKGVIHETAKGKLAVSLDLYRTTLFDLYTLIPREPDLDEALADSGGTTLEALAPIEKEVTLCMKGLMDMPVASLLEDSLINKA
ncbi:YihY family inner membrane protein [Chlorobium sp.]|uniref:YihY family inner membrane protein n=1 Tax=Chlorobium sp. TaxID=1095 RepID=UPI0025BCA739|nr:YihY family inner membrane protein [Chlorobium sp.]